MWFEKKKASQSEHQEHILFLFPYSGGSSEVFDQMIEKLPVHISAYVFQLPGMGIRFTEPLSNDIDYILNESLKVMNTIINGRKFSFYGHSTGALFAYLFTLKMNPKGGRPMHLWIAAESAPHVNEFHENPIVFTDQQIAEKLKRYGKLSDEVIYDPDFMEFYYPIMRNEFSINYQLNERLKNTCLDQEFILIHGEEDSHVKIDEILAWETYTSKSIVFHRVQSGHFFIEEKAKIVAQIICSYTRDH